jgi:hypothetical protein
LRVRSGRSGDLADFLEGYHRHQPLVQFGEPLVALLATLQVGGASRPDGF